jgi:hypothetical protein
VHDGIVQTSDEFVESVFKLLEVVHGDVVEVITDESVFFVVVVKDAEEVKEIIKEADNKG